MSSSSKITSNRNERQQWQLDNTHAQNKTELFLFSVYNNQN